MTYRAQIEDLLAAGNYPGDAEAAAEIGCSPVTAEDYRQRWQRVNDKQHENNSGIMPREAVDLVFDLRGDRLSFKEIARRVNEAHGEYYGIHVTAGQCGNVYRHHGYAKPKKSKNIDYLGTYTWGHTTLVPRYTFPFETTVGVIYGLPVKAPLFDHSGHGQYETPCDHCPHRAWCMQPGVVCRCEIVQESEVLE
jgi:hypothetical protein